MVFVDNDKIRMTTNSGLTEFFAVKANITNGTFEALPALNRCYTEECAFENVRSYIDRNPYTQYKLLPIPRTVLI